MMRLMLKTGLLMRTVSPNRRFARTTSVSCLVVLCSYLASAKADRWLATTDATIHSSSFHTRDFVCDNRKPRTALSSRLASDKLHRQLCNLF